MDLSLDTILNIIGLCIAIFGPAIGAFLAWRNRFNYSWGKTTKAVKELHSKLVEKGLEPNVILAFAKGGLIVADLLNHHYDNRFPIVTIYTKRVWKDGHRLVQMDTSYVDLSHLKGKKVFLVDDVIQSGSTLQAVVNLLVGQYGVKRKDITVIVLATNASITQFQPDVYVYEFEYTHKRPVLPWGQVPRD